MKIEVNFLTQKEFDKLQTLMMGDQIPWFFNDRIDYEGQENKFKFYHIFYTDSAPCSSFCQELNPIFNKLNVLAIIRIKANLLTKTPTIVENDYHVDISNYNDENRKTIFPEKLKQLTTSIFYINTNDGYTKFENGKRVESIANRMVTFPANMRHTGTSCTNEKRRVVINFNFFC